MSKARWTILVAALLVGACESADDPAADPIDPAPADGSVGDGEPPVVVDVGGAADAGPVVTVNLPGTDERLDVRLVASGVAEVVRPPARLRVLVELPVLPEIMNPTGPTRADACAAFVAEAITPELLVDARQFWAYAKATLEYGPRDPRVAGLVVDAFTAAGVPVSPSLVVRWPELAPATTDISFAPGALAPLVPADSAGNELVSEVDASSMAIMITGVLRYDVVAVALRIATVCDLEHGLVNAVGASAPAAGVAFELVLR